ncbi:MAG: ATP-dependent transcriptional regulator, partial [Roseobacter sp.]
PHAWQTAIQTTLGPGASRTARSTAANTALTIAQREGWTDHRLAFTQYARGRVLQQSQPLVARQAYLAADEIYARSPTTQLHRAYVATQLAAYALVEGDGDGALQLITPYLAPARRAQNAALLATLQLMQAEALTLVGRDIDARATRLDSLGWARYGFGPDWAVRAKQSEISSLPPASPPA